HGYGGPVGQPAPSAADDDAGLADQPERARGVVLLARRRDDYRPAGAYRQRRYHHETLHVHYRGGPWEVIGLRRALTGRLASGGEDSWLTLPVEGSAVVLHFWANPWGGE